MKNKVSISFQCIDELLEFVNTCREWLDPFNFNVSTSYQGEEIIFTVDKYDINGKDMSKVLKNCVGGWNDFLLDGEVALKVFEI